jgi:DNA-binding winged helix-turn-helix (wHTH) protein
MALCERCSAEIEHGLDRLPAPHFDHDSREIVRADGSRYKLSPTLWRLLQILWHRRPKLVSWDTLMLQLYGGSVEPDCGDKLIKVYVCHLRRALRELPYSINTLWGTGYRLVEGWATGPLLEGETEIGPIEPWPDGRPQPRLNRGRYPFRHMHAGQSFVVANGQLARLQASCREARYRGCGGRFRATQEPGGIRVTKTAD